MAAITWRNIEAPSIGEVSRAMALANQTINSGLDSFGNVLKKQEATDQGNWNQVKENNTQDFLNKLYSAQGADGFKALQDSGELDRMIAANGAQIDQAAVRAAMDTRLDTLQQRDRSTAKEAQEVLKRPLEIAKLTDELKNGPIDRAYKQSQIGLNAANARHFDSEAVAKAAAKEAETGKKAIAAALAGNRYADGELKSGDAVGLVEMMNKYKIGDDGTKWWNDTAEKRQKIIERLDTLAKNGHEVTVKDPNDPTKTVKIKVPYAKRDVQDALLGATDKTFSWNEGWADSMENILKKKYAESSGVTVGSGAPSTGSGRFPTKPGAAADSVIAREYQDYLGALNMGITASGGGKPKKK